MQGGFHRKFTKEKVKGSYWRILAKKDLNSMIKEADLDNDGFFNRQGKLFLVPKMFPEFFSILCVEVTSKGKKKKIKDNANRIKEEGGKNDSSRSE